MSSILRALRKLEGEKAEMGEGSVDIARDILKRSYEDHPVRPKILLIAGVLLGIALIAGGTFLYFQDNTSEPSAVESVNRQAESSQLSNKEESRSVAATAHDSDPPVVIVPDSPVKSKKVANMKSTEQGLPTPTQAVSAPAIQSAIVIPDLFVEEIVHKSDRAARLAVVNELPVMEGTDIEGATVVEIFPDRVRFSFKGIQFDKFLAREN